MKPFNPVVRNRLLNDSLQVQMVGKAFVRVTVLHGQVECAVFMAFQEITALIFAIFAEIEFVVKGVVKQRDVCGDDELKIGPA